jgi:carboxypeptidase D
MHGDEVVGMEMCLDLIDHLLTQYGSDPTVTQLVDETSIWIMPLMNPDGYVAHSRYNAQGSDLNREFPDRINDPVNTTAGRPVEVQHVMNFGFAHSSVISANFHGGALVVNYPYDSGSNPWASYAATPDDGLMVASSLTYSQLNLPMYQSPVFSQGIVNGVEWYAVYGGMQDWNYEWLGCNEVTIELSNQKWPNSSALPGFWSDNKDSMLAYMQLAQQGVRGLVTDVATGAPLAASVRIVGVDHSVYTDPDVGDYHRMLLPGTYDLEVSAPGYQTQVLSGLTVGAGNALVADVALVAGGPIGANPDIKINGQDGPLSVAASATTQITVTLAPGSEVGVSKDWWITVTNGSATFYWNLAGGWSPSPSPAYTGALFPLSTFTITSGNLPPGTWTFTFAVDAPDGTYQGTAADAATVTSS